MNNSSMLYRKKSDAVRQEIESLCAANRKTEAQNKTLAWVKSLKDDAAMQAVLDCAGQLSIMLPLLGMVSKEDANQQDNICDAMASDKL